MSTSLDSQFAILSSIATASDPSKNMQKEDSSSNYREMKMALSLISLLVISVSMMDDCCRCHWKKVLLTLTFLKLQQKEFGKRLLYL